MAFILTLAQASLSAPTDRRPIVAKEVEPFPALAASDPRAKATEIGSRLIGGASQNAGSTIGRAASLSAPCSRSVTTVYCSYSSRTLVSSPAAFAAVMATAVAC
ncbi:MAG: hypothetical protein BMS9Abin07_1108 [Acidimicrobiia bacterium]|nr:MAG: hypothetical protein BMS9Abin07_1108 [Acidimicrobiia bacterium]